MLWEETGNNYSGPIADDLTFLLHKFACLSPVFLCLILEGEMAAENLQQNIGMYQAVCY